MGNYFYFSVFHGKIELYHSLTFSFNWDENGISGSTPVCERWRCTPNFGSSKHLTDNDNNNLLDQLILHYDTVTTDKKKDHSLSFLQCFNSYFRKVFSVSSIRVKVWPIYFQNKDNIMLTMTLYASHKNTLVDEQYLILVPLELVNIEIFHQEYTYCSISFWRSFRYRDCNLRRTLRITSYIW